MDMLFIYQNYQNMMNHTETILNITESFVYKKDKNAKEILN